MFRINNSGAWRSRAEYIVEGVVIGGAEAVDLVVLVPSFGKAGLFGTGDPLEALTCRLVPYILP